MTFLAANSSISPALDLVTPAWSCPSNVVAYTTTRSGGGSMGDFAGLNVGAHVGDDLLLVKANRSLIPNSEKITWLEQVHSNRVVSLPSADTTADAAYSSSKSHFCAVMTADCVPILLCDGSGQEVAAVHAGWKGLETNIIKNAVIAIRCLQGDRVQKSIVGVETVDNIEKNDGHTSILRENLKQSLISNPKCRNLKVLLNSCLE